MHKKSLSFGIVLYCMFLAVIPILTIYHIVISIIYGGKMWLILLPLAFLNIFLIYRLTRVQNLNTLLIVQLVNVSFFLFCAASLLFNPDANKFEYAVLLGLNIIFILFFRGSRFTKVIYSGKPKRFKREVY